MKIRALASIIFIGSLAISLPLSAQEINPDGWPVPNLAGAQPLSIKISEVSGVEMLVERFRLGDGKRVSRISGNGKVFAYAVGREDEPSFDYVLIDPAGDGKFTMKLGPEDPYLMPEWIFR